jgi:hypothetical protein
MMQSANITPLDERPVTATLTARQAEILMNLLELARAYIESVGLSKKPTDELLQTLTAQFKAQGLDPDDEPL